MFHRLRIVLVFVSTLGAPAHAATGHDRMKAEADAVTITRDDWGIAHVHGRTDADAVFGAIYAQAEDDFNRIEMNYLTALGWTARTKGESAIWNDLRYQLFIDPVVLKRDYAKSPGWLKKLMDAWADGLNWYLATHPDVHPKAITHFEPWMALSFTEGSIGGDIESVDLAQLAKFYGADPATTIALARTDPPSWSEPAGSNGIAIAPKLTVDGHALLWINPHTSFYFRSEFQMTSDEGLDAYGAATWGQFFIYQGFNRHVGWMHTSTGADAVDEFAETMVRQGGRLFYRYGNKLRPVASRRITIQYRADGTMKTRTFNAYFTHHGPIVRSDNGRWIAQALMNTPIPALEQSFLRTKAHDLASYMQVAALKANSSNNTLFADDKGEIAFLMPQFIPKRSNRFDYTRPVDGSDPATDWQGLTPLDELPNVVNPPNGWVFNTNNWPYSAAGANSPKRADFPRYMDSFGENPRGNHALQLLTGASGFSKAKLIADAFDSHLPAFARLIPILIRDFDALPANDPQKSALAGPVALLRGWNFRWSIASMPTSLAVFWGDALWNEVLPLASTSDLDPDAEVTRMYDFMAERATPKMRLDALAQAVHHLEQDFGSWGTAWGEINRYQRLDDSIEPRFDDARPSIPIPFTSSRWGSLASFGAHRWEGTKRFYGNGGNSFLAAVEFGPKVSARAVTAGGESGHPGSKHFTDQAERYATGNLRTVYFWPEQLRGHTERTYHPGE